MNTAKHSKVWSTYLDDGTPDAELDALIEPRCYDSWQKPGFHLNPGDVIPLRLADGSDAYGVVAEWVVNSGVKLMESYLNEAAAQQRRKIEQAYEVRVKRSEARRKGYHPDWPEQLWGWDASIDAWVEIETQNPAAA